MGRASPKKSQERYKMQSEEMINLQRGFGVPRRDIEKIVILCKPFSTGSIKVLWVIWEVKNKTITLRDYFPVFSPKLNINCDLAWLEKMAELLAKERGEFVKLLSGYAGVIVEADVIKDLNHLIETSPALSEPRYAMGEGVRDFLDAHPEIKSILENDYPLILKIVGEDAELSLELEREGEWEELWLNIELPGERNSQEYWEIERKLWKEWMSKLDPQILAKFNFHIEGKKNNEKGEVVMEKEKEVRVFQCLRCGDKYPSAEAEPACPVCGSKGYGRIAEPPKEKVKAEISYKAYSLSECPHCGYGFEDEGELEDLEILEIDNKEGTVASYFLEGKEVKGDTITLIFKSR